MSGTWWINGVRSDYLPADSRGLAYGDGLFETMRQIGGTIPLYSYHRSRLESGMSRLGLTLDRDKLNAAMAPAISTSDSNQSVLKLLCVRSGLSQGYRSDETGADFLLRQSRLLPGVDDVARLSAQVCSIRLASQPALAGLKHLSRLEQVIAARELGPETDEGILLDANDNLIEAISSNLILISGNTWVFPDLSYCGVEGVMQAYIKDHASNLGVNISTEQVSRTGLPDFDEILITNAVRGVRNLGKIGDEWVAKTQTAGNGLRDYLLNELHADFHSY